MKMALKQIVETVTAAREIIRRRIGILSGSYAELSGSPRELKSAAFGSRHEVCRSRPSEAGFSTVGTFRLWLPSLRRLTLILRSAYPPFVGSFKSPVTWLIVPAFAESPAAGPGDGCAMREDPLPGSSGAMLPVGRAHWNIHSCLKLSRNHRLSAAFL